MQEDIAFFAKTNFRNQERVFGIKTDDRRRHMYVIRKTGMGKTNLLENLVIQDIQKGHGVAFIDPHGDTAEKLIKAIPRTASMMSSISIRPIRISRSLSM